ncbi:MAG: hypothetical protein RL026_2764, partial [Pseudomonadota bacterium]
MASDPRQTLAEAHQALTRGNPAHASRLLATLSGPQADWAPAVHLAGLVARAQGDLSRAEDLMRRSLSLPGVAGRQRAEYANNLGNLLRGCGFTVAAEAAYREAVAASDLPQARVGLARVFLESDRAEDAIAVLARIPPAQADASVYVLLSEALATCGDEAGGLGVLSRASAALQALPLLQLARAERLTALGQHGDAGQVLQPLLGGPEDAAAHLALAQLRSAQRDWAGALEVLGRAIARHPRHVRLLQEQAALAWMTGRRSDFAAGLKAALAASPGDAALRLALASSLANAGFEDDGETVLREGLGQRPDDAALLALLATRCAGSGRADEAASAIKRALELAGELPLVREQAAIVALGASDVAAALDHTAWLVAARPLGQFAWALRVAALRLADDPSWPALADPAQVCQVSTLEPPPGFADLQAFNAALAQRLRERHSLVAHPLVNSVRGGTQVEIPLAAENDPLLRAFLEAVRKPVAEYIAHMPDDALHPLWRRKRSNFRLSGCWSVRLRGSAGRHVSHIHPEGWISSAYYVDVPAEVTDSPSQAGWLSFGRPPYPAARLDALGHVRPEA